MKRKFQSVLISSIVLALAFALSACGGGSSGTNSATSATGKFVDGPAEGLGYSSGLTKGITGADGSFTYEPGKNIKFFVGNVSLGEALGQPVITPLHLFPDANATTPQVVRIVRFLLSIGVLNPDNSITISSAISAAAYKVAPVDVTTLTDDVQLDALVKAVKGNTATLVAEAVATSHLSQSVLTEYKGTYNGGFTGIDGDADRTWVLAINSDGSVTGYGSNKVLIDTNGDGVRELVNEVITGSISNGTDFTGIAAGGCKLTGKLNLTTRVLSGTWLILNTNPTVSGTFSGRM